MLVETLLSLMCTICYDLYLMLFVLNVKEKIIMKNIFAQIQLK